MPKEIVSLSDLVEFKEYQTDLGHLKLSPFACEMLSKRPPEQLPFERGQGSFEDDLLRFLMSYQETAHSTNRRMRMAAGMVNDNSKVNIRLYPSYYDNPEFWDEQGKNEADHVIQQQVTPYMKCSGGLVDGTMTITILASDKYPTTGYNLETGKPLSNNDPYGKPRSHDMFTYMYELAKRDATTVAESVRRNTVHEAAHETWGRVLTPYTYEDKKMPNYTTWCLLEECISLFADGSGFRKKDLLSLVEARQQLTQSASRLDKIEPGSREDSDNVYYHGPRVFCEMLRKQFPLIDESRFAQGISRITDTELAAIWTFVSEKWNAFKNGDEEKLKSSEEGNPEIQKAIDTRQLRFVISIADELKQTQTIYEGSKVTHVT